MKNKNSDYFYIYNEKNHEITYDLIKNFKNNSDGNTLIKS